MEQNQKKKRSIKVWMIVTAAIAFCFAGMGIYLCTYYHSQNVEEYLQSSASVQVSRYEEGLFFDGESNRVALIFYPGAKVETDAYAPLMYELAERGVDCFLVDMPFHMAFFGIDRAEEIIGQNTGYEEWYLGGHSLGGAMAAQFAAGHTEDLTGLLLLAAYPTGDLSDSNLKVLTVYGSEDGVLHQEKVTEGRKLLPDNRKELCIQGGNHAQFGSYGEQKGDGKASVTAEEQRKDTEDAFIQMVLQD